MFGKHKPPPLKSLVASGTLIRGDITFEDGLRIDGQVHGQILGSTDKASVLVIGEGALVVGEVCADHVIINGEVRGPVTARRLLELQPKAFVQGDVVYQAIELHLGAKVSGRLSPIAESEGMEPKPTLSIEASPEQEPTLDDER